MINAKCKHYNQDIRISIVGHSCNIFKSGRAQFDLVQISVLPNNEIPI
jgi:hypothetical protein